MRPSSSGCATPARLSSRKPIWRSTRPMARAARSAGPSAIRTTPNARRGCRARGLDGLRIGVIREYMNKKLFAKADEESIDIVDRAIGDLRKLGATIVDPGPEGALFQSCVTRYAPELLNARLPAPPPADLSIRNLGAFAAQGEGKYMMNKYLRERGDANIKDNADLISKATFYQDQNFPDRKQMRE